MIPQRVRAVLPAGHWYIVVEQDRRVTVILSAVVPVGSPLEHELVRDAMRAWRRARRQGDLTLLPVPVAGAGALAWLARQARRPAIAGATVVTAGGLALAAVIVDQPPPRHRPPPVSGAPPLHSPGRAPGHQGQPLPPPVSPESTPRVDKPRAAGKTKKPRPSGESAVGVHVPVPTLPVPPLPPVQIPPTAKPTCTLVEVEVGQVRVCV